MRVAVPSTRTLHLDNVKPIRNGKVVLGFSIATEI
jgi:hypothetical protein